MSATKDNNITFDSLMGAFKTFNITLYSEANLMILSRVAFTLSNLLLHIPFKRHIFAPFSES